MIKQEINTKELLGERLGKAIKSKINNAVYWMIGVVFLGGLSNAYSLSKGFFKGWNTTRIANINR